MARKHRLLVMSIGSLVGTAVLECLHAMGRERFEIIGTNSEPSVPNGFRADVCYRSPLARDREALLAQLDAIVHEHSPDLVIPTRDDDVVALAQWVERGGRAPAMVGSVAIAQTIRDKWKSACWATERGLPFARSAIDAAGVAALREAVGLPLVCKPREGFGSNGVRLLVDDAQVDAALATPGLVFQEPIDPAPMLDAGTLASGLPLWYAPVQAGSPLTLCLLDNDGVHFLASWTSKHVRGVAFDTRLLDDDALRSLAMRYGEAAWREGWRGLFNIQARRNAAGEWIPIELAGRFMGGTNALHALGVPVVSLVLSRYLQDFDGDPTIAGMFDARVVKLPTTHLVPDRDVATLERDGVWRRSAPGPSTVKSDIRRVAACSCGQLTATTIGEPVRISVCHCLACQRRTGSVFGAQARFPRTSVTIRGRSSEYVRIGDSGGRLYFHFCPDCGSTVHYHREDQQALVAIPIGAFADPSFPAPRFSVYERRRHAWVTVPGDVEHSP